MQTIDIILLGIICGFALAGFGFGFIHTLGSLLGTVFGVYLASRYYMVAATLLMRITGWQGNIVRVVMFVVAFLLISRLVGILFWFLEKFFKIFKFIPFFTTFDKFLGLLMGLAEGIITVGIAIFFIQRFPLSQSLMSHLAVSKIAPYTLSVASILWPLLPDAIKLLKSTVDSVEKIIK